MASSLAHVMIVGGTRSEWRRLELDRWRARTAEWGTVVADAGGGWLTVRAYEEGDDESTEPLERWHATVGDGRCAVIVDPIADGRQRFAEAMSQIPAGRRIDEKAVAGVLYEPADVEPDLVVVLGPSTRLPASVMWELAYGELVFLPVTFGELSGAHVAAAIEDFHGRRRRFGGLDS